ncbi:MAG: thioredoxin family protein [Bacteroides sp.]|nr:thioredoxin family protein [Bacteroides sp.]
MTFSEAINSSRVVLVEFYASWCPHCQRMMPIVAQVKELLAGSVPVYQYDIDVETEAANEAGVQSIPTFIVYDGGTEVWRHSGEIDGEILLSKVESFK